MVSGLGRSPDRAAAAPGASDDDAMELDRLRVEALLRHGAMDEGLALWLEPAFRPGAAARDRRAHGIESGAFR